MISGPEPPALTMELILFPFLGVLATETWRGFWFERSTPRTEDDARLNGRQSGLGLGGFGRTAKRT